ncbi:MAG: hypothetical protein SW019_16910 [Actinomycetota bacterium]|nr:hypothetical protein [Actinomycetota bacterium]
MPTSLGAVERMLRDIEHRVLHEMSLGRVRSAAISVLGPTLAVTAVVWWIDLFVHRSPDVSLGVPTVAFVILAVAALTSMVALGVRRFRWSCAAAYSCALGTVVGIGAFWWVRTGPAESSVGWLVAADLAVLVLAAAWLSLLATPVDRSQPDMRRGH